MVILSCPYSQNQGLNAPSSAVQTACILDSSALASPPLCFAKKVKRLLLVSFVGIVLTCGWGCAPTVPGESLYTPVNDHSAVFWDRQTTESAELLKSLAETFNAHWDGLPIKVERAGSYTDIFRKITAGIHAKVLPAMAVSYESMTSEYINLKVVYNLDTLIHSEETGFTEEELADFFPDMLKNNRFPEFGNSFYSFPFAKSILMLYYNKKVLAEAGIAAPPETWTEFLEQCRQIKEKTGKYAHAVHADCSTLNGIIFSMGGEVVENYKTCYNSDVARQAFHLYETLAHEKLAYIISPGSYEDNIALARDDIAFVLRSSSGIRDMKMLMEDDLDRWGIQRIPQTDPSRPATVLYGPNVCLFNIGEEQVNTAWAFVKYFTNPEISLRWALETGYMPVRKSALEYPAMRQFWEQWSDNRAPYDCLSFARAEPNIAGWQQVRDFAARTITEIMTGIHDADTAAKLLSENADQALARGAVQVQ